MEAPAYRELHISIAMRSGGIGPAWPEEWSEWVVNNASMYAGME